MRAASRSSRRFEGGDGGDREPAVAEIADEVRVDLGRIGGEQADPAGVQRPERRQRGGDRSRAGDIGPGFVGFLEDRIFERFRVCDFAADEIDPAADSVRPGADRQRSMEIEETGMHHSRLCAVLIDCNVDDVDEAACFWAEALGRPVDGTHPMSRGMLETPPDEPIVEIQRIVHESRVRIDIETDDIPAEVARLEKLGAKVASQRALGGDGGASRATLLCRAGPAPRFSQELQPLGLSLHGRGPLQHSVVKQAHGSRGTNAASGVTLSLLNALTQMSPPAFASPETLRRLAAAGEMPATQKLQECVRNDGGHVKTLTGPGHPKFRTYRPAERKIANRSNLYRRNSTFPRKTTRARAGIKLVVLLNRSRVEFTTIRRGHGALSISRAAAACCRA
jgi:hypothetical protein